MTEYYFENFLKVSTKNCAGMEQRRELRKQNLRHSEVRAASWECVSAAIGVDKSQSPTPESSM
jgi:hypothetical protein